MSAPVRSQDAEAARRHAVETARRRSGATLALWNRHDAPDLVAMFLLRLRLALVEKAASRSKEPNRERQRLLASSTLGSLSPLDSSFPIGTWNDAHADACVEAREPLLWPTLPIGVRADDPEAAYEAELVRILERLPDIDGTFVGVAFDDEPAPGDAPMPDGGVPSSRDEVGHAPIAIDQCWIKATGGAIAVELVPPDQPGGTPVPARAGVDAEAGRRAGAGGTDDRAASAAARSHADALRRLRLADPSLLSPGIALVAVMLARALAARPSVAHDLVHRAPVVIVRVPDSVSHDTVAAVIEQCLTEWPVHDPSRDPLREAATGSATNTRLDHAGTYGRYHRGRGSGDDLSYDGPALEDDDLYGAPIPGGWQRSINTIDLTSRSGKEAGVKIAGTIAALQAKRRTVLIHATHDSDLPPDLLALADAEVVLSLPDPDAMMLVVEAVTGERPTIVPSGLWSAPDEASCGQDGGVEATDEHVARPGTQAPSLVPTFTFTDALSSLSPLRGATGSLARLERLTQARTVRTDTGVSAASEDTPPLEDLAGYGRAREEGLAIAADLSAYKAGRLGWSSVARGMVLAGPPGTGKSLFARALARSADVPLVIGSIAAWQAHKTGHLGDMLAAMRACFEEAKQKAPCILFIDELDSIGDRSQFTSRHRDYSVQVVNALLEQLDGAGAREGVVVCGATNDPTRIDPAVLRPGRMERVVWIGLPNLAEIIAVLRTHLKGVPVVTARDASPETTIEEVVAGADDQGEHEGRSPEHSPADEHFTPVGRSSEGDELTDPELRPVALALRGRTGADIAAAVRRARGAARRDERELAIADLLATAQNREGPRQTEAIRRRSAVHEAGHAVACLALNVGTIIALSLDHDGGTTRIEPAPFEGTRAELDATLAFTLAGRAAEVVLLGAPSSGSGGDPTSDLARATRTAVQLHASHGLGDALTWHGDLRDDGMPLALSTRSLPPHLHGAVEQSLQDAYDRALDIIRDRQDEVEALARKLLAEGYVEGTAITAIGSPDNAIG